MQHQQASGVRAEVTICTEWFSLVGLRCFAGDECKPELGAESAWPLLADRKLLLSCRTDSVRSGSTPTVVRPHSVQVSLLGHHCNLPDAQGP